MRWLHRCESLSNVLSVYKTRNISEITRKPVKYSAKTYELPCSGFGEADDVASSLRQLFENSKSGFLEADDVVSSVRELLERSERLCNTKYIIKHNITYKILCLNLRIAC